MIRTICMSILERYRRYRASKIAALACTARLSKEASIENIAGDKERVQIGGNSRIRGRLLIYGHGGNIKIGEWCYVGVRSEIWSMESIEIGDRVLIAHNVNIHDGSAHSLDMDQRHEHFRKMITCGHPRSSSDLPGVTSSSIVIEDDVWISFGVTILKGVRIGAGSIIGANAIVTEDVLPGVIYRSEVKPIIRPL